MGSITIDIDRLLENTSDLEIDPFDFPMKKVEIDKVLETTRD